MRVPQIRVLSTALAIGVRQDTRVHAVRAGTARDVPAPWTSACRSLVGMLERA